MKQTLLQRIYKNRGIISQLLFLGLILFAQQGLMKGTIHILYDNEINYLIGGIIGLAFILESIGAFRAIPALHRKNPIDKSDGLIFFGLLMHCVVAMMLVMTFIAAVSGTGIANVDKGPYPRLMGLIFIEVIRHLVIPIIVGLKSDTTEKVKESPIKEMLGELFMLFWTFIAYTLTRSAMTTQGNLGLGGENIGLTIIYTLCAAIIFWVFYLGANLVGIIQQYEQAETKKQKNWFRIYMLIVTIVALAPLFTKPATN